MLPKITIVTSSYNQGQFIEKTIQSVLMQNYPNLEYIIIDGGSTDNSVDIIKKYKKYLTYWVSEKDQGQTHAINKGFKRANGDVVNWLNSDDLLEPNALQILSSEIAKIPEADIFFGDYRAIDSQSKTLYTRKSAPYQDATLFWGRQLSSQPAVFFRRQLLTDIGYLNETLQFCMDTEFWIRCAQNGAGFHQIESPLGVTRVHIDAKTSKLQTVLHEEHKKIVRNHNALNIFTAGGQPEDIYFSAMNKFCRLSAAVRRLIYRKDYSFFQASKALKSIKSGDK